MKHENIEIPAAVRQKAVAQGAEGRNWLHRVASLFIELEHDWFFTVEATLAGGSESLVAAATTNAGERVVVEILMPPYATYDSETRYASRR